MISKTLSDTYSYLDNIEKKKEREGLQQKKRSSRGDWPALEAALFEWQQRIEAKRAIITGDVLKEKVHQF